MCNLFTVMCYFNIYQYWIFHNEDELIYSWDFSDKKAVQRKYLT